MPGLLTQYYNCRILWKHKLTKEDVWVRDGKIQNPRKLFFDEGVIPDRRIDCGGHILAPGYIDLQLNGAFEFDFSSNLTGVEEGLKKVSYGLLQYGVTSFCPTVVTSPSSVYKQILPQIKVRDGSLAGAGILGVHIEGPFISIEKCGAHPVEHIKNMEGFDTLMDMYGTLDNVAIVTIAPELDHTSEVIPKLTERGIVVSLGHSMANLEQSEKAVQKGAKLITHLFNAMLPFHHRDPGIVGLLTSSEIPDNQEIYYGMIADGIHTNPAALRIAHRAHPNGLILVTDAISAMGLSPGVKKLGQQLIRIHDHAAYLDGTNTLAGSIATMPHCVRHFREATGCSIEEALEAATLHPAQCLGIEKQKGTLDYDSDADFILLDDDLHVLATFIAGECAFDPFSIAPTNCC